MRRYWVPAESVRNDLVSLTGDVLHHIRDVCRMRMGARFEVLNSGKALLVEIVSESRAESVARVLEERRIEARPKPDIVLVCAVPRFPVFEAVAEKAVELGVSSIHLVYSEYSFARANDQMVAGKRSRWEKIVLSATQQSGRGDLMPIHAPIPLEMALESFNRLPDAAGLFAYEGEGTLSAKQGLGAIEYVESRPQTPGQIHVFVGAEGGFSLKEVELFKRFGLQPVTLGGQVLRVETACVALVSIIKYHFGQMR